MSYEPDLDSEYDTGDQPFDYRKWRGWRRSPSWKTVKKWRTRWTREKVECVLHLLGQGATAQKIGEVSCFGTLEIDTGPHTSKTVPDLRGLDLALLPPDQRNIDWESEEQHDLSRFRFEGARLTDLNLYNVDLSRASLKKATLRRVDLSNSDLSKAHLEDTDLRAAQLNNAKLAHIRYTEDTYLQRGTVLMENNLDEASFVDPLLKRCAQDQYYLYVLKYRNRNNYVFKAWFKLWWLTCDYGRSFWIWTAWSVFLAVLFGAGYYWGLGASAFEISQLDWNLSTTMYYSVVTFTTLGFGDIIPKTRLASWMVMSEVIVGYIMLGGLISIFANKLARRS